MRHWHVSLAVVAVVIGLIAVFWPRPLPEPAIEPDVDRELPTSSESPASEPMAIPKESVESSAAASGSNGSLLVAQAVNAWHTGDISGAMTLFEQAIDEYPDDPEPHSEYGRLLILMVSYEKALPLLERARDLKPGDAQVWLDLATLYERAQLFDKSWAAQAEAAKLVGSEVITRDEQGRFIVEGSPLW